MSADAASRRAAVGSGGSRVGAPRTAVMPMAGGGDVCSERLGTSGGGGDLERAGGDILRGGGGENDEGAGGGDIERPGGGDIERPGGGDIVRAGGAATRGATAGGAPVGGGGSSTAGGRPRVAASLVARTTSACV